MPYKPKPSLPDARTSGRCSLPAEIVDGDTSAFTGIYGIGKLKVDAKRKKKGTYARRDMRAKD